MLWVVKKVWRCVFYLNILLCNLLFLMYISYSNLIDGCFLFNSFKNFLRSVLLPVHMKNILSINLRYISENVLINGYMDFLSKWSMICINVCTYLQGYNNVVFVYWRLKHPIEQTQEKCTFWLVIFIRHHH